MLPHPYYIFVFFLTGGSKLALDPASVAASKFEVTEPIEPVVDVDEDLADDDIVDLRLFSPMGSLICVDLLQLPPQPKEVKGWVMQQGLFTFCVCAHACVPSCVHVCVPSCVHGCVPSCVHGWVLAACVGRYVRWWVRALVAACVDGWCAGLCLCWRIMKMPTIILFPKLLINSQKTNFVFLLVIEGGLRRIPYGAEPDSEAAESIESSTTSIRAKSNKSLLSIGYNLPLALSVRFVLCIS